MRINAVKFEEVQFENACNNDHPYIMDLSLSKYDFQKGGEQNTGYSISEINKNSLRYFIYIKMGMSDLV